MAVSRKLGPGGVHLWELSQGLDERPVVPDHEAKSIGAQDTFEEDLRGEEALAPHVHSQALRVGRRLRHAGRKARCVQLSVKYDDFEHVTRRKTLEVPTDDGQALYREAMALLRTRVDLGRSIRLTGVSAQEFDADEPQLALFAPAAPARSTKLNEALDRIAQRFGGTAVVPADLAGRTESREDEELRRQTGASQADAKAGARRKPPG